MIEFKNINKTFGGTRALNNISFSAGSGEILALLGQNGAGKSTLMKILSGAYQKDSGQLLIDGKAVEIESPVDAEREGIGIVYQELSGLPHLTTSENIVIGRDPVKGGFLDIPSEREIAKKMLDQLEAGDIPLNKPLGRLSVSQQQICEIAKCMASNPKIVVFDEPTTALTSKEKNNLFKIMKKMRDNGMTIIFVTHFLEDAIALSDKCVILKDGQVEFEGPMEGLDEKAIVSYMISQKMESFFPAYEDYRQDKVALEVRELTDSVVRGCSLKVSYGEVLGLSGLIGAGRTELAHLIFGSRKLKKGQILIDGEVRRIENENDAALNGIAYISEDRRIEGLSLTMGIDFNLSVPSLVLGRSQVLKGPMVKEVGIRSLSENAIESLGIKCSSRLAKVQNLSGGNQQKVSIGKWLEAEQKILIFDEPTKGIDVSAKAKIYEIIRNLAKKGCAIIVISSYNPELLGICDRIEVMSKGRLVGNYDRSVTEEELTLAQQD